VYGFSQRLSIYRLVCQLVSEAVRCAFMALSNNNKEPNKFFIFVFLEAVKNACMFKLEPSEFYTKPQICKIYI
jgi:hypothetical protein